MASKLCMLVMSVLASFQSFIECGTHLDKPWFNWEGGVVPYYFNVSVTNDDRVMMRHMMKQIEKKSCIKFKEQVNQPSGHHLEIQVHSGTSCVQLGKPRFSAAVYAEPPRNQKVILYSAYKLADKRQCWAENRGGLLHEMFHLFGIMHTQMRSDRDQHITILRNNIQRSFSQEYDICHECNNHGVPYDCNSIMHYGAETFSTGQWTMRAKSKSCDLRWVGAAFDGRGASPNDWLLLKRVTRNMCSNKSNRRPRKGKSLGFDEPTDSNSTDDNDEKYRLIIN